MMSFDSRVGCRCDAAEVMLDYRRGINGFWSGDHNRSELATVDDDQKHQNCD